MTTTWRNHISTTFGTESCGLKSTLDHGTSSDRIPPTSYQRTDAPSGHPHPFPCHLVVGPCERVEPSLTIFAFTFHLIEKAKDVCLLLCPWASERRVPLHRRGVQVSGSVHRRGSSAHVLSRKFCFVFLCRPMSLSRDTHVPFLIQLASKTTQFLYFFMFSQSRVLVNAE